MTLANFIVTDYVREQLPKFYPENFGELGGETLEASLVVPFFDEASMLPCLSQTRNLRFRGIDGMLHFLRIWPDPCDGAIRLNSICC